MSTAENQRPITQWVADNVNHKVKTLTGKRTFHGMDIISLSASSKTKFYGLKRLKHDEKVNPSLEYQVKVFFLFSMLSIYNTSTRHIPISYAGVN